MRYSLYKDELDNLNVYRLYLKLQDGSVVCYTFKTMDLMISNLPNATRWFGSMKYEDDYYLYPVSNNGISVGEYEVIQLHEQFVKIRFTSGIIEGEWYLRNIQGGEVLFWKPRPVGFVCNMKSVDITPLENSSDKLEITQAFGSSLLIDGNTFSGPCISAGIATGIDRISTLFTDAFLRKFEKKLIKKMPELVVDIDHELLTIMQGIDPTKAEKDSVNTGKIEEIKLKENSKINYIWCKGQTTYQLPATAGMSVTLKTDSVWDDKLKIFVAVDGDPIGISITDKIQPACKICWVE